MKKDSLKKKKTNKIYRYMNKNKDNIKNKKNFDSTLNNYKKKKNNRSR